MKTKKTLVFQCFLDFRIADQEHHLLGPTSVPDAFRLIYSSQQSVNQVFFRSWIKDSERCLAQISVALKPNSLHRPQHWREGIAFAQIRALLAPRFQPPPLLTTLVHPSHCHSLCLVSQLLLMLCFPFPYPAFSVLSVASEGSFETSIQSHHPSS